MRNAGAVIHSHGIEACLATMINPSATEFRVTTIMWRDGWIYHACLGSHVSFLWTTTTAAEDSTKVSMKRKTGIQLEFLWNLCIWLMIMLWLSFCKEEKERKLAYVQHSLSSEKPLLCSSCMACALLLLLLGCCRHWRTYLFSVGTDNTHGDDKGYHRTWLLWWACGSDYWKLSTGIRSHRFSSSSCKLSLCHHLRLS